jgi:uncharacterized protein YbjT (DUF2867 family)
MGHIGRRRGEDMAEHSVLVFGGAGKSGTPVVRQALERGYAVTAFVRHPEKAAHLPKQARIVPGDGTDAAAVAAAIPGHDTVITTIGDRRTLVSAAAARHAVAGMQAAGVRRIILLSAYGIGDSAHGLHGFVLSRVLGKLNVDKVAAEQALETSGLDWTAVRPPVLGEGPSQGPLRAGVDITINGFQTISREDLATFMLEQIEAPTYVGKKPIVYR